MGLAPNGKIGFGLWELGWPSGVDGTGERGPMTRDERALVSEATPDNRVQHGKGEVIANCG
jgi:hypothetical protein